jgi:hypothetical protein
MLALAHDLQLQYLSAFVLMLHSHVYIIMYARC